MRLHEVAATDQNFIGAAATTNVRVYVAQKHDATARKHTVHDFERATTNNFVTVRNKIDDHGVNLSVGYGIGSDNGNFFAIFGQDYVAHKDSTMFITVSKEA